MRKFLRVLALIAGFALLAALAACSPEESGGAASSVYYTVTFDAQGGSEVESQSVLAGNPVRRPVNPERADHYFVGWFDEAEGGERWDFGTDRVTGDLTLYAHWSALPAEGEEPTATESLTYERYGEGYAVTGVGEESVVVIPSVYEELPVVAIHDEYENGAFANARFTEIYIPDSVTEIGRNTFYSCMELEAVHIGENSALASIGRNAFSGCSSLAEMYIPAGVTSIGDSAFNNCGAINFSVADGNASYRSENGHLIERTTDTLIRAGQSGEIPDSVRILGEASFRRAALAEVHISAGVTEIRNYAFGTDSCGQIVFAGSEEEWNAIDKQPYWDLGNGEVQILFEGENDL